MDEDTESSPRKRSSSLKSSPDDDVESKSNSRRKKHKRTSGDDNRNKRKHESNEASVDDDKENNGRPPPSSRRSRVSNDEGTSANGFFDGRNINQPNKPPEAGVISKIYVENFMCHKKLTVELCRNINFIYGQNGSGKSAILAAIQVCLGAGARRTNRARNLKGMVRKGTTSNCARIRVTLLNQGDDSFKHDIYGDFVTVERTIAIRGGYNGYKLFDANLKERSRSKKELDEMLDKLNIQVENPVALLDQEEAKKFLTGKAADKYKFFMKATELERLDNTYASTVEKMYEMNHQAEKLEQSMSADKELVDETKAIYKQHKEIAKLEAKQAQFQNKGSWSVYRTALLDLKKEEQQLEKFQAKAEKKKQELTQAEIASQEADDPDNERRNRLDDLSKEANEMADRKRELEKDLKHVTEPQKHLKSQYKALVKKEEKNNRDLLEANQILQKKRDEIVAKAGSAESEQRQRNERIISEEETLAEKKKRFTELKQEITDSLHAYEKIEPDVTGARDHASRLQGQVRKVDSKIKSLESSSGNSLDVFGPRCNKVKQLVDKAIKQRKFRGPVLGPIGLFCKIQPGKEDFASLAESALGNGVLDRFVVFNDVDRKLLQKIRETSGCHNDCGLLQQYQSSTRHKIPEAPEGVETIASVLTIENDLIFNCLVDCAKIEQKALTGSKIESEKLLLLTDNRNRNSIRGGKIKEVYFLPSGDSWKVMKGLKAMVSNNRSRMKQSIGLDRTAAIKDANEEYEALREELKTVNHDYSRLEHEHTDYKKRWNQAKKEKQKVEKAIDRTKQAIDDIKAEESANADIEVDTSMEEQDVAEAQDRLDEVKNKKVQVQEKMKEIIPDIEAKKGDLAVITARNDKISADLKIAENELTQHYQLLTQQKEKMEKTRQKLLQYEELVQARSALIVESRDETLGLLQTARRIQLQNQVVEQRRKQRESGDETVNSQIIPFSQELTEEDLEKVEIPDDLMELKDADYYFTKIKRGEAKIEREKARRLEDGADDEVAAFEKYVRAQEIYKSKNDQLEEIQSSSKKLEEDMDTRRNRWSHFRNFISMFSGSKFDETLNIKGSSGAVTFDHENKELDLVVQKDSFDENSQQKDVKALSGGEKSFTTIALLLALGESLETPFRVMDEFDVFLDPVTRKLIIDVLIEVGKKMLHRQFIFITPQDVSNVTSSPLVKILQMKPPERMNIAGAPTQQTLEFSQN